MKILAIDTSCDDTSVAVTEGRRILSNEKYSQILIHEKWGGVVPNLSKRAHEERIDSVIERGLKKANTTIEDIDYIAVTYGPGLAIALGVGIEKAKALSKEHGKKLIAVNHMEGHIYSCFAQNSKGNPERPMNFPYLVLLVSGGHTELVMFKDHLQYEVIGKTVDDAVGEALDKGARVIMNEQVYPGGPLIEKLAQDGDKDAFDLPRPKVRAQDLDFSYSGLKTALLYTVQEMDEEIRIKNMSSLAASYQEAAFHALIIKLRRAMKKYNIVNIAVGGGVAANEYLRKIIRSEVRKVDGEVCFPTNKDLNGDNAAMIGIVAHYKAMNNEFVEDLDSFDREARAEL